MNEKEKLEEETKAPEVVFKFSDEEQVSKEELAEMKQKRDEILRMLGYGFDEQGRPIKPQEKKSQVASILYFRLNNGTILKIDNNHMTCYRLNQEKKEWNEDSVLYAEYSYGNLQGEPVEVEDSYPIGEPFQFHSRRSL